MGGNRAEERSSALIVADDENHNLQRRRVPDNGCSVRSAQRIGYGLAEEEYQESLEIELELRAIPYSAKAEIQSFYKNRELKRRYVPDLLVFNQIVVELKAVAQLVTDHEAQLINYLRLTHRPMGYLINFGHKDTLEWQRLIFSEFLPH